MIELSVIRDLVAIFGVIAGFTYYVLTVRNSQRTRELALKAQELATETRQAQLFMDFYKLDESKEFGNTAMELMWLWEWDDWDDFIKKYSPVSGSVDNYSKMISVFLHYDGLGVQAKKGLIDVESIYDLYSTRLIPLWEKFALLTFEARRRVGSSHVYEHFEWLYDEMKKIQGSRGHEISVDTIFKLEENEEKPKQ